MRELKIKLNLERKREIYIKTIKSEWKISNKGTRGTTGKEKERN